MASAKPKPKPRNRPKGRRPSRAQARKEIRVVTPGGEPAELPKGALAHAKPGDEIVVVDAEEYSIKTPGRSKVRHVTSRKMLSEHEIRLRDYETRHGMSSETMTELVDTGGLKPTPEVMEWYLCYAVARSLRDATPTAGFRGPDAASCTNSGPLTTRSP